MNVILGVILFASLFSAYNPFVDGAVADIKLIVKDEQGNVVPDAKVAIAFAYGPVDVNVQEGRTDDKGEFRACKKCTGDVKVRINKDGYYETLYNSRDLWTENIEWVRKNRRWSKEQKVIVDVLKSKHESSKVIYHHNLIYDRKIPSFDIVLGYDLKKNDWCRPFGKGVYDDLQIKYERKQGTNPFDIYQLVSISMTNCVDGYIRMPIDKKSAFRTVYEAPIEGYMHKPTYLEYNRRGGTLAKGIITDEREFPKDEYIVFRTRTITDETGSVVSAHYGYIAGLSFNNKCLECVIVFNEEENNRNIENNNLLGPDLWIDDL